MPSSPEKKRAYMREYLARPEVRRARRESYAKWADQNREHLRERERLRQLEKRGQVLVAYARRRAKERGLPFDLDDHVEEIQRRIDAGQCELSGLAFSLVGGRTWDSPSIHRREPAGGYVIENVQVICHGLNAALGEWGSDVLELMVTAMQSFRSSRRSSSQRSRRAWPHEAL